jgi:hypothetical protein
VVLKQAFILLRLTNLTQFDQPPFSCTVNKYGYGIIIYS